MKLLKAVLGLQFAEASRPWLEIREMLRIASGKSDAEIQAAPMVLDRPDLRQRIELNVRAVTIQQDAPESPERAKAECTDLATRLSQASPFPPIDSIKYESIYIEPYPLPFHELVAKMKEKLLRPAPTVDLSTDIALVLDQRDEHILKHTQLGPMDADQLRTEFLRWPPQDLPATFTFVGLLYQSSNYTTFSRESLAEFLVTAAEWERQQADLILRYIQED